MARPARKRHFSFLAIAAALLAPSSTLAALPAPVPAPTIIRATPALWIIRDADTTIYLFGTFHSLDGNTVWMEHEVRRAFQQSDELVLETVVPTDPAALKRSAADAGAGRSSFLKGTHAAMAGARSNGMSVDNGADAVLRRLAEQAGKKVSGLEDFTDQLKTLSALPAAASAPAPAAAPTPPVTVASLFDSWRTGNGEAFGAVLASLESKSPQLYQALIARRNVRWASWIARRLDQPGTVFVAVGTGHLTGKDSVQRVLAAQGIRSARIA